MKTRLTLRPGQNGTKKLVARYGDRLLRVRYIYDADTGKRYKTAEIIVEETAWTPGRTQVHGPNDRVWVEIGYDDAELRRRLLSKGAVWRPRERLWSVPWRTVRALGIEWRVVDG